jgi:hypothetical protein
MSYYPTGTCAADPQAPWNAPCTDRAQGMAVRALLGEDVESTSDCLVAFVSGITEHRTPLMVKTEAIKGPISTAELLKLMLDRRGSDQLIAAATRELASRYLDCAYTRNVIDGMADRFMGVQ